MCARGRGDRETLKCICMTLCCLVALPLVILYKIAQCCCEAEEEIEPPRTQQPPLDSVVVDGTRNTPATRQQTSSAPSTSSLRRHTPGFLPTPSPQLSTTRTPRLVAKLSKRSNEPSTPEQPYDLPPPTPPSDTSSLQEEPEIPTSEAGVSPSEPESPSKEASTGEHHYDIPPPETSTPQQEAGISSPEASDQLSESESPPIEPKTLSLQLEEPSKSSKAKPDNRQNQTTPLPEQSSPIVGSSSSTAPTKIPAEPTEELYANQQPLSSRPSTPESPKKNATGNAQKEKNSRSRVATVSERIQFKAVEK